MTYSLESDNYNRANGSGWGTASDANIWSKSTGTGATSIASNQGNMTTPVGLTTMTLGSSSSTDAEVQCDIATANAADVVGVVIRWANTSTFYRVDFGGNATLRLRKGSTNLQTTPFTPTLGTLYTYKIRISGNNLYGKVWATGQAEPDWMLSSVDASPIASGAWGVIGNPSTGSTLIFDNFQVNQAMALSDQAESKFIIANHLSTVSRSKFVMLMKGLVGSARSKFSAQVAGLVSRARAKFVEAYGILSPARSKFPIRGSYNTRARSKFQVKSSLLTGARSAFPIRMVGLAVRTRAKFLDQLSGLRSLTRSKFLASSVLKTRTWEKFQVKSVGLSAGSRSKFLVQIPGLSTRTRAKFSTQIKGMFVPLRSKFSVRIPLQIALRSKFSTQLHSLNSTSRSKFIEAMVLTSRTRAKFLNRIVGLTSYARAKFLEAISFRIVIRSRLSIRLPMSTFTRSKFSVRLGLRTFSRVKFLDALVLSTRAQGKFLVQMKNLITRVQDKFRVNTALRTLARSRFSIQFILKTQSRSKFVEVLRLTSAARSKFFPRISLFSRARSTFAPRLPLSSAARSKFLVNAIGPVSRILKAAFSYTQKINAVFQEPIMARPYSTITAQTTVTDAGGNPINNLTSVSVMITFPDGSVSAPITSTNLGNGLYQIQYNTKMQGLNRETWSFTGSDGSVAQYTNITPVAS